MLDHEKIKRSNADKRKMVMELLKDPDLACMSDSELARQINVSQPFVSKIRFLNQMHDIASIKGEK